MRRVPSRAWLYLTATTVLEVIATLSLKASNGFSALAPSIVSIAAYVAVVPVLAAALKYLPMGLTYIIWTGAGTAGVVVFGAIIFGDELSVASWLGVAFIIGGVALINGRGRRQEVTNEAEEYAE